MSGSDWERVKTIFETALGVAEPERSTFLKSVCLNEPNLYATVLDLLQNYSDTHTTSPPVDLPHTFQQGDFVAERFRILHFVNTGGMGEVYEVFDERLKLRLALKTLRSELTSDRDAVARFRREIRVARGVSHENLCKIYEFVEHFSPQGQIVPCLTMEFIEGETLSDYLLSKRPLAVIFALPIVRQIVSGLNALHRHGILHRDLKPSNIMLEQKQNREIRAVVMDFGLAKALDTENELFESSLNSRAGAPYFMAPEVLRGERPSIASDIYALGLIIDEMVTRSRAFSAISVQALYYAKFWEEPISPRERSDGLPATWVATILRCLTREPGERFASTQDLVRALESNSAVRLLWFRSTVVLRRETRRLVQMIRRSKLRSGVILLAIIVAVGVAAVFATPARPLDVFEFENQTGETSYNYLCHGLTAELARRFGQQDGIRTVPVHRTRTATPNLTLDRFTLDGKMGFADGQPYLEVFLIDARHPASPLWFKRFGSQEVSEPVQVESEVISRTRVALEHADILWGFIMRLRRSPPFAFLAHTTQRITRSRIAEPKDLATTNNRALDDFMRGRQLVELQSPDSVRTGMVLLQRAISEDPSFALGYTALANANFTLMNWNYVPQAKLLADAKAFANTAVTLDPNLPEAYEARALVYQHEWDWEHAKQDYLQALQLKPTFAIARRHYAILLTQLGSVEEGVRQAQQALEQDPYDQSALPGYGLILYISGRYSDAIHVLEPLAIRNSMAACQNLGEVYSLVAQKSTGKKREDYFHKALEQAARVQQLEGRSGFSIQGMRPNSDRMFAQFYAMQGNTNMAEPYIDHLKQEMRAGSISPAPVAWVYAELEQKDEAFHLLEQAVAYHDRHLLFIKVYPFLESLRGDQRFQRILSQMHL